MSKDGKELEKIVHLIERSINLTAIVEHNVYLPIKNSNSKAQCDITITQNQSGRKTLTIVEVQDRKSQVKINDFRGWIKKMEDVGAQHLICVSRKEFPKSIKEYVASSNQIYLIKLSELDPDNIPFEFIKTYFSYRNFSIKKVSSLPSVSKSELKRLNIYQKNFKPKFNLTDKLFSYDCKNLLSIYQICRDFIDYPKDITNGTFKVSLSTENSPLFMYFNNHFIRITLDLEYEWINQIHEISSKILTYEQNEVGVIACFIECNKFINNKLINFKIPIIKKGKLFSITQIEANIPIGSEVNLTIIRNS